MKIGDAVRRPGGKWHRVESVVAGDAVTHCGRRMDRIGSDGELETRTRPTGPGTWPLEPGHCRRCV